MDWVLDSYIRQMVKIDEMWYGFAPGRGTTHAIFVVCQLQQKYIAANKLLYFASVDFEKAFDRVLMKVQWWANESISNFKAWKAGMEGKWIRVNTKKTKFLVSGVGQGVL